MKPEDALTALAAKSNVLSDEPVETITRKAFENTRDALVEFAELKEALRPWLAERDKWNDSGWRSNDAGDEHLALASLETVAREVLEG